LEKLLNFKECQAPSKRTDPTTCLLFLTDLEKFIKRPSLNVENLEETSCLEWLWNKQILHITMSSTLKDALKQQR
jgi:hypothetical protein